MEVTSSSSSCSYRPEPNLIGVSVFQRQNLFSLRFHLRATHLERINNPKTLGIRGSAQNGFILTPDSEAGVKPSRVAKSDLFYVMQTLTKFDLSKRERRTVRTAQDGWNPLQRHFRTERAAKPGKMTAHRRLAEIVTRICFYASARAFSHDQDPYRTFLGVLLLRKNAVPQKWRSKIHIGWARQETFSLITIAAMLCRIEPGVSVIPRPGRQKPQQPQDLACRRSCLVLNRPSSDLGLRASMPSPRLGDVPHDPIIESATRQVEAVRNCLSGVTYERFLERYVGHCGAFLALVICAALLTFPAGGGDLKVKDGIFTGERLTFTVPKSAGITLSVDNEQLASGTSDQQTMLCLGAVEPGQTILLYLTRHPGIPKDTDLTKYVEAIEASGKGNFSAFSRSGQTNVDKTTTRGDYDVKSGDDEYRAIYLFHKTADGKFYTLAILTKKSAWLSKRGDVEKIVKSFGEAK